MRKIFLILAVLLCTIHVSAANAEITRFHHLFLEDKVAFVLELSFDDGWIEDDVTVNLLFKYADDDEFILKEDGDYRNEEGFFVITKTETISDTQMLFEFLMPFSEFPDEERSYYPVIEVNHDDDSKRTNLDRYEIINLFDVSMLTSSDDDTVGIFAGDFFIEVHQIWDLSAIVDEQPENDHYLIFDVSLYNLSESQAHWTKNNFSVFIGDAEYVYDVGAASKLIDEYPLYHLLDYPGTDNVIDGHDRLDIKPNREINTILIFDVPYDLGRVDLYFKPTDNDDNTLELWINPLEDNTYSYADVTNTTVQILDDYTVEVDTILDAETGTIDNCNGTGNRISSREFAYSFSTETVINFNLDANFGVPIPFYGLAGILDASLQANYLQSESQTLSATYTEAFETPPGKTTNYEVVWYLVSLEGIIQVITPTEVFDIPFSVGDRVRGEVHVLPASDC